MRFVETFKNSNILQNIGAGFIFKFASVILSFLYVPICRAYLGDLRYGVWATISSLVFWITLSDIGIGYGLRNRLTEALARDDKEEAQGLVSTAYRIMFLICAGIFVIYLILSKLFDLSSIFNIAVEGDNVNLALTITVGFMCINFWLGLATTVLYAVQKAAISSLIAAVNQFLNIIFVLLASHIVPVSLPTISILLGGSTFITEAGFTVWIFNKYKYLKPVWKFYDKKFVKLIASFGVMLFISQICSMVMNSTDNILISKFFGATNVTPYNTAFKLFQTFIVINGIIVTPMWSAFTLHNEQKDYAWMKRSLKKMNQINIVLSVAVVLLAFLLPTISDIWLQHHLEYDPLMLGIMAAYIIIMNYSINYATLLNGVGDVKLSTIVAAIQAVLNIPLSLFLALSLNMGLSGIIGGTFGVTLLSFIVLPIKVKKWFDENEKRSIS